MAFKQVRQGDRKEKRISATNKISQSITLEKDEPILDTKPL